MGRHITRLGIILVFALLATATAISLAQKSASDEPEAEVVRVETNLVNTLFTAIDSDQHFITSLRAQDVRVYENDVEQPISLFEGETDRPIVLAILVDTSESQRGVLAEETSAVGQFALRSLRNPLRSLR